MGGDGYTGAGGSWEVQQDIIVCADTTGGADALCNEVTQIIQQAGKNVTNGGVGSSKENSLVRGKTNTTIFWIVNGVDRWMCSEFDMECGDDGYWKGCFGDANHCNIVVGFWTGGGGACSQSLINNGTMGVHDGGWATAAVKSNAGSDSADAIMRRHSPPNGWVAGPDANSLAQTFLTGKGSGGGGGAAGVVEGHIFSHEGEPPQFWNSESYFDPIQIKFTNYTLEEEYPRIRTATFESPENIDLTEGRVAVLITGDCNDFGGIIIKKTHDHKTGLYKYQCQGFMERIMSSPVYVVANGGKTAHRLIQEYLNDIGLPDTELGEIDDYDVFVDEETQRKLEESKEDAESTDVFNAKESLDKTKKSSSKSSSKKKKKSSSSKSSDSSSKSKDSDGDKQKAVDELEEIAEENKDDAEDGVINTFKRKPVGLYDKPTGGDWIRTMILDYGINIDFYGDVNGIPHFDIMDMDEWTNEGWYIAPDMGMEQDYDYAFDITNIVTQVGVKNVSAINGNGELYTAEELLDLPLDNYVGRMGTIVDNPSSRGGNQAAQGETKYLGEDGNMYDASQILTTNGEPSCSKCAEANGGQQPEQKSYQKYWVNKCPGCEKEGTLKSEDGKTVCSECNKEYCQFCGYDKSGGSLKLIGAKPVTTNNATGTGTTGATAGTTTGGSNTDGALNWDNKLNS